MTARRRSTAQLTLGFLTLGAQAAPLDVIAAASAAGFGAAGLRVSGRSPGQEWPSSSEAPALAGIRAAAQAVGVRISSISGYYLSPAAGADHLLANVRAADQLGTGLIAQGCFDPDRRRVAAMLRDYAAAAKAAGIRIALEFMPMSELKDIRAALDVIDDAGADNIGLLVDALHLARSGAGAVDVASLEPTRIYLTQLCDAAAQLASGSSLYEEAMTGRLYPGDGALDLAGFLRALSEQVEIELETPVVADAALTPALRAQRAADKASAFFARCFS